MAKLLKSTCFFFVFILLGKQNILLSVLCTYGIYWFLNLILSWPKSINGSWAEACFLVTVKHWHIFTTIEVLFFHFGDSEVKVQLAVNVKRNSVATRQESTMWFQIIFIMCKWANLAVLKCSNSPNYQHR